MQNYSINTSETTQKLYNYNVALNEMFGTVYDLMLRSDMTEKQKDELYAKVNDMVSPLRNFIREQLIDSIRENILTTNDML